MRLPSSGMLLLMIFTFNCTMMMSWTLDGEGPKYYLFTHVNFDVLYNADRIIDMSAFSYPNHMTSAHSENRLKKYSNSLENSLVLVS
ncbi:hypothetical protein RJ641_033257 [Dillenia turbinata]|uniref:Uncharacterized protein n=1 Tax=Dillenia turbinata TaxID=194707 RepID=A0AAN8ZFW5_9MAGN